MLISTLWLWSVGKTILDSQQPRSVFHSCQPSSEQLPKSNPCLGCWANTDERSEWCWWEAGGFRCVWRAGLGAWSRKSQVCGKTLHQYGNVLAKKKIEVFYMSRFQNDKLLRKLGKLQRCSHLSRKIHDWKILLTQPLGGWTTGGVFERRHLSSGMWPALRMQTCTEVVIPGKSFQLSDFVFAFLKGKDIERNLSITFVVS